MDGALYKHLVFSFFSFMWILCTTKAGWHGFLNIKNSFLASKITFVERNENNYP
jgi:hypothetical protein